MDLWVITISLCYNITKLLSVISRTVRVDEDTYKRSSEIAGRIIAASEEEVKSIGFRDVFIAATAMWITLG